MDGVNCGSADYFFLTGIWGTAARSELADRIGQYVIDHVYGGTVPGGSLLAFTKAEDYWYWRMSFQARCATSDPVTTQPTSAHWHVLGVPESGDTPSNLYFDAGSNKNRDDKWIYTLSP